MMNKMLRKLIGWLDEMRFNLKHKIKKALLDLKRFTSKVPTASIVFVLALVFTMAFSSYVIFASDSGTVTVNGTTYSRYKNGTYQYVTLGSFPKDLADGTEGLPGWNDYTYDGQVYEITEGVNAGRYLYERNTSGEGHWYKFAPITWQILNVDDTRGSEKLLLLSESCLESRTFDTQNDKNLVWDGTNGTGKTDGRHSYPAIRLYLNSYDCTNSSGSATNTTFNSSDNTERFSKLEYTPGQFTKFYDKGFLEKAFSELEIENVIISDHNEFTYSSTTAKDYNNVTTDIDDKVRLLSSFEMEDKTSPNNNSIASKYGFATSFNTQGIASNRLGFTTDYSKSKNTNSTTNYTAVERTTQWYFTKSRNSTTIANAVSNVGNPGTIYIESSGTVQYAGIRPLITVSLKEINNLSGDGTLAYPYELKGKEPDPNVLINKVKPYFEDDNKGFINYGSFPQSLATEAEASELNTNYASPVDGQVYEITEGANKGRYLYEKDYFGSKLGHWYKFEPIKWQILSVDKTNNSITVMTENCIDSRAVDTQMKQTKLLWDGTSDGTNFTSTSNGKHAYPSLRLYLNSYDTTVPKYDYFTTSANEEFSYSSLTYTEKDESTTPFAEIGFMQKAFTDSERESIIPSTSKYADVSTDGNKENYKDSSGNYDKIRLLGYYELLDSSSPDNSNCGSSYGFGSNASIKTNRIGFATDYSLARNVMIVNGNIMQNSKDNTYSGYDASSERYGRYSIPWQTKSISGTYGSGYFVYQDGSITTFNFDCHRGIRPVMTLSLNDLQLDGGEGSWDEPYGFKEKPIDPEVTIDDFGTYFEDPGHGYVYYGRFPKSLATSSEETELNNAYPDKEDGKVYTLGEDEYLYELDLTSTGHWYKMEPIKWQILKVDEANEKIVLLSESVLESRTGDTSYDKYNNNFWTGCQNGTYTNIGKISYLAIRLYLNSYDSNKDVYTYDDSSNDASYSFLKYTEYPWRPFYERGFLEKAFTSDERDVIIPEDNLYKNKSFDGEEAVFDKVRLLTGEEVKDTKGTTLGFDSNSSTNGPQSNRLGYVTDYSKSKAYSSDLTNSYGRETQAWLLRSVTTKTGISTISNRGVYTGTNFKTYTGVRPVITLDVTRLTKTSGTGSISNPYSVEPKQVEYKGKITDLTKWFENGSDGKNHGYLNFGKFPKTKISAQEASYLGLPGSPSEGKVYTLESNGKEYLYEDAAWWRIEPIKWQVLDYDSSSGDILLLSESVLELRCVDYPTAQGQWIYWDGSGYEPKYKNVNGKTIYAYPVSRLYLNSYDSTENYVLTSGTKCYSSLTYTDKIANDPSTTYAERGFLEKAFTNEERGLLLPNKPTSSNSSRDGDVEKYKDSSGEYDKVRLLTLDEIYLTSFGFGNSSAADANKYGFPTDYVWNAWFKKNNPASGSYSASGYKLDSTNVKRFPFTYWTSSFNTSSSTTNTENNKHFYYAGADGKMTSSRPSEYLNGMRPVIKLNANDLKALSGDGSSLNPYTVGEKPFNPEVTIDNFGTYATDPNHGYVCFGSFPQSLADGTEGLPNYSGNEHDGEIVKIGDDEYLYEYNTNAQGAFKDQGHWFKIEPIRWRILDVYDDKDQILLMSDLVIDARAWDTQRNNWTFWDGSRFDGGSIKTNPIAGDGTNGGEVGTEANPSIRLYLNSYDTSRNTYDYVETGNNYSFTNLNYTEINEPFRKQGFLQKAFTKYEQNAIIPDWSMYARISSDGYETLDKVRILSLYEMHNYSDNNNLGTKYGFAADITSSDINRRGYSTAYAESWYPGSAIAVDGKNTLRYWTKTRVGTNSVVNIQGDNGKQDNSTYTAINNNYGLKPVITLSITDLKKLSGKGSKTNPYMLSAGPNEIYKEQLTTDGEISYFVDGYMDEEGVLHDAPEDVTVLTGTTYFEGVNVYSYSNGMALLEGESTNGAFSAWDDYYDLNNKRAAITNNGLKLKNAGELFDETDKTVKTLEKVDLTNFDSSNLTDTFDMFKGCTNLESITFPSDFNTSQVDDFSYMFNGCESLEELDLSTFEIKDGANVDAMFGGCANLEMIQLPESVDAGSEPELPGSNWGVYKEDGTKLATVSHLPGKNTYALGSYVKSAKVIYQNPDDESIKYYDIDALYKWDVSENVGDGNILAYYFKGVGASGTDYGDGTVIIVNTGDETNKLGSFKGGLFKDKGGHVQYFEYNQGYDSATGSRVSFDDLDVLKGVADQGAKLYSNDPVEYATCDMNHRVAPWNALNIFTNNKVNKIIVANKMKTTHSLAFTFAMLDSCELIDINKLDISNLLKDEKHPTFTQCYIRYVNDYTFIGLDGTRIVMPEDYCFNILGEGAVLFYRQGYTSHDYETYCKNLIVDFSNSNLRVNIKQDDPNSNNNRYYKKIYLPLINTYDEDFVLIDNQKVLYDVYDEDDNFIGYTYYFITQDDANYPGAYYIVPRPDLAIFADYVTYMDNYYPHSFISGKKLGFMSMLSYFNDEDKNAQRNLMFIEDATLGDLMTYSEFCNKLNNFYETIEESFDQEMILKEINEALGGEGLDLHTREDFTDPNNDFYKIKAVVNDFVKTILNPILVADSQNTEFTVFDEFTLNVKKLTNGALENISSAFSKMFYLFTADKSQGLVNYKDPYGNGILEPDFLSNEVTDLNVEEEADKYIVSYTVDYKNDKNLNTNIFIYTDYYTDQKAKVTVKVNGDLSEYRDDKILFELNYNENVTKDIVESWTDQTCVRYLDCGISLIYEMFHFTLVGSTGNGGKNYNENDPSLDDVTIDVTIELPKYQETKYSNIDYPAGYDKIKANYYDDENYKDILEPDAFDDDYYEFEKVNGERTYSVYTSDDDDFYHIKFNTIYTSDGQFINVYPYIIFDSDYDISSPMYLHAKIITNEAFDPDDEIFELYTWCDTGGGTYYFRDFTNNELLIECLNDYEDEFKFEFNNSSNDLDNKDVTIEFIIDLPKTPYDVNGPDADYNYKIKHGSSLDVSINKAGNLVYTLVPDIFNGLFDWPYETFSFISNKASLNVPQNPEDDKFKLVVNDGTSDHEGIFGLPVNVTDGATFDSIKLYKINNKGNEILIPEEEYEVAYTNNHLSRGNTATLTISAKADGSLTGSRIYSFDLYEADLNGNGVDDSYEKITYGGVTYDPKEATFTFDLSEDGHGGVMGYYFKPGDKYNGEFIITTLDPSKKMITFDTASFVSDSGTVNEVLSGYPKTFDINALFGNSNRAYTTLDGGVVTPWSVINSYNKVIGDNSYAINRMIIHNDTKASSGYKLFAYLYGPSTIEGLDKLDTTEMIASNFMFMNSELQTLTFGEKGTFESVIDASNTFYNARNLTNIYGIENITFEAAQNLYQLFGYCSSLEEIDLSSFKTSNATQMNYMFDFCNSLTGITFGEDFDTSNVQNLAGMFMDCTSLTSLDISMFDTEDVTSMCNMFFNCKNLQSLSVSNFDTSKVTDMSDMFVNCASLTSLDVSNFSFDALNLYEYGSCSSMFAMINSKNDYAHYWYKDDYDNLSQNYQENCDEAIERFEHDEPSKLSTLTMPQCTIDAKYFNSMFLGLSSLQTLDMSHIKIDAGDEILEMIYGLDSVNSIKLPAVLDSSFNGDDNLKLPVKEGYAWIGYNDGNKVGGAYTHLVPQNSSLDELRLVKTSIVVNEGTADEKIYNTADALYEWDISENGDGGVLAYYFNGIGAISGKTYDGEVVIFAAIPGSKMMRFNSVFVNEFVCSYNHDFFETDNYSKDLNLATKNSLFNAISESRGFANWDLRGPEGVKDTFAPWTLLQCIDDSDDTINKPVKYIYFANDVIVGDTLVMFADLPKLEKIDLSHLISTTSGDNQTTNMSFMFEEDANLTSIVFPQTFNTSKVTDISFAFYQCSKLEDIDIRYFDSTNIKDAQYMFECCNLLTTINMGNNFTLSNCENFSDIFEGCESLEELDISKWNTSSAVDLSYMFYDCKKLSTLKTGENFKAVKGTIEKIDDLFAGCEKLEKVDLSGFDISLCNTDYGYDDIFEDMSSLKEIILPVAVSTSKEIPLPEIDGKMWRGYKENSKTNETYKTLPAKTESVDTVKLVDYTILAGDKEFKPSEATYTWDVSETAGSKKVMAYYFAPSLLKGYDGELVFLQNDPNAKMIKFDDAVHNTTSGVRRTNDYAEVSAYIDASNWDTKLRSGNKDDWKVRYNNADVLITPWSILNTFSADNKVKHAIFAGDKVVLTEAKYLFAQLCDLEDFDIDNADMTNITSAKGMFEGCSSLDKIYINFRVDNTKFKSMEYMFDSCSSATEIKFGENFDTSGVTTMRSLFSTCENLVTLDVSNLDTSNVENMIYAFGCCESIEHINISNFNFQNVNDMNCMFECCYKLEDITFPTVKHNALSWSNCMYEYFLDCHSLKHIYNFGNLDTSNVSDINCMFWNCVSLEEIDLSQNDFSSVDDISFAFASFNDINEWAYHKNKNLDTMEQNEKENFINNYNLNYKPPYESKLETIKFNNDKTIDSEYGYDGVFFGLHNLETLDLTSFKFTESCKLGETDLYHLNSLEKIILPVNVSNPIPEISLPEYPDSKWVGYKNGSKVGGVYTTLPFNENGNGEIDEIRLISSIITVGEGANKKEYRPSDAKYIWDISDDDHLGSIMAYYFDGTTNKDGNPISNPSKPFDGELVIVNSDDNAKMIEFTSTIYKNAADGEVYLEGNGNAYNHPQAESIESERGYYYNDKYYTPWSILEAYNKDGHKIKSISFANDVKAPSGWLLFAHLPNLEEVKEIEKLSFDDNASLCLMFANDKSLCEIDLSDFDISKVTTVQDIFAECESLKSVKLPTTANENLEKVYEMFFDCFNLESVNSETPGVCDLSSFDMHNAYGFDKMFINCWKIKKIDFGNNSFENAKSMNQMFLGCHELTDVKFATTIDTSKLEEMSYMFVDCPKLTKIDLSMFDASSLKEANYVFSPMCFEVFLPIYARSSVWPIVEAMMEEDPSWVSRIQGLRPSYEDFLLVLNTTCESNLTEVKFGPKFVNNPSTDPDWPDQFFGMFFGCDKLTKLDLSTFNFTDNTLTNYIIEGCTGLTEIKVPNSMTNAQDIPLVSGDHSYWIGFNDSSASCGKKTKLEPKSSTLTKVVLVTDTISPVVTKVASDKSTFGQNKDITLTLSISEVLDTENFASINKDNFYIKIKFGNNESVVKYDNYGLDPASGDFILIFKGKTPTISEEGEFKLTGMTLVNNGEEIVDLASNELDTSSLKESVWKNALSNVSVNTTGFPISITAKDYQEASIVSGGTTNGDLVVFTVDFSDITLVSPSNLDDVLSKFDLKISNGISSKTSKNKTLNLKEVKDGSYPFASFEELGTNKYKVTVNLSDDGNGSCFIEKDDTSGYLVSLEVEKGVLENADTKNIKSTFDAKVIKHMEEGSLTVKLVREGEDDKELVFNKQRQRFEDGNGNEVKFQDGDKIKITSPEGSKIVCKQDGLDFETPSNELVIDIDKNNPPKPYEEIGSYKDGYSINPNDLVKITINFVKLIIIKEGPGGTVTPLGEFEIDADEKEIQITVDADFKASIYEGSTFIKSLTAAEDYLIKNLKKLVTDLTVKVKFVSTKAPEPAPSGGGGGGGGGVTYTILPDTNEVLHKSYIKGYEDKTFRPNNPVTREEVATIVARLDTEFNEDYNFTNYNTFPDVDKRWSKNYIGFCKMKDLIHGYEDGSFGPTRYMTRAELAVLVSNFLRVQNADFSKVDLTKAAFSDVDGRWYEEAVNKLALLGILNGYEDGTFRGDNPVTRIEVTIVMNKINHRTVFDEIPEEYITKVTSMFKDVTPNRWFFNDVAEAAVDHPDYLY